MGTEKVSCSKATQTDTKPDTKPSTVIVAPVVKTKQWKQRSTELVKEAAPPEWGREEGSGEAAYAAAGQGRKETGIIRGRNYLVIVHDQAAR